MNLWQPNDEMHGTCGLAFQVFASRWSRGVPTTIVLIILFFASKEEGAGIRYFIRTPSDFQVSSQKVWDKKPPRERHICTKMIKVHLTKIPNAWLLAEEVTSWTTASWAMIYHDIQGIITYINLRESVSVMWGVFESTWAMGCIAETVY
jgi:hypothetical protein